MVIVAGVDEAGRGSLAGVVVAAAVIFPDTIEIRGITDSKRLTAKQRNEAFERIHQHALAVGVGSASVEEIDQLNILRASLLAMQRAVDQLGIPPQEVWVDGNHAPQVPYAVRTIVGGDHSVLAISAASIIAKVTRDRYMDTLHESYPHYGFSQHKGYPTSAHVQALQRYGASPVHRRSFAPVSAVLMKSI